MNEADVRAHSYSVNESMSNTDSDKKQRTKLRKRQLKCAASTGGKKKKENKTVVFIMEIQNQFQLNAGPKFSNQLKPRAFKPHFIDAGPPCVFQH